MDDDDLRWPFTDRAEARRVADELLQAAGLPTPSELNPQELVREVAMAVMGARSWEAARAGITISDLKAVAGLERAANQLAEALGAVAAMNEEALRHFFEAANKMTSVPALRFLNLGWSDAARAIGSLARGVRLELEAKRKQPPSTAQSKAATPEGYLAACALPVVYMRYFGKLPTWTPERGTNKTSPYLRFVHAVRCREGLPLMTDYALRKARDRWHAASLDK